MNLFGFEIKRSQPKDSELSPIKADVVDDHVTSTVDTTPGSFQNSVRALTIDTEFTNENNLIEQYRSLMNIPEVKRCVNEIVAEAIITPDVGKIVKVVVDDVNTSDDGKDKINDAFEYIYELLMFDRRGHDIFRRWFVDGRINYFVGIDAEKPSDGIQYLQYVDPRKIKKIKEVERLYDPKLKQVFVKKAKTYFVYNELGLGNKQSTKQHGIVTEDKILTDDGVVYVTSGDVDPQCGFVIGHLHNAIRVANNLRMMEDSALIYRLARAPERRVVYVDTGDLPKAKADAYVKSLADSQRAKVVYDATTGDIKNDRKFMALTEDFWIPRKGGSTGTEIQALPGGQMVGEMGEAEYFKEKLYIALGVPQSRFQESTMFSGGTQVTRDELRFSRMIQQFRSSFSVLFEELLRRQLVLTNIISDADWDVIKNQIRFEFAEDSHFAEAIRQERLQTMSNVIQMLDQFVGKYFSREYVFKHVIGMNEEEMKEQLKLIDADKSLNTTDEDQYESVQSVSDTLEEQFNEFMQPLIESYK